MEFLTCVVCIIFISFISTFAQDPIVGTKYGNVQGKSIVLDDGKTVDSYLGIPFAKPPVGNLRFTPPLEPDPWDETFPATEFGNPCMQNNDSLQYYHEGWTRFSEDCLNLNIFTPQNTSKSGLLPVMVWIHGGGFQIGANINYPGYFIARKEVVFVAINYRLGIFGESAGASSVGLLMISPSAAGLFHGAILQSGSELAPWSMDTPEAQPETFLVYVAEQLGCPTDDSTDMVTCLREIDANMLVDVRHNCTPGYFCGGFRPVIDGDIIPDLPKTLREKGQYSRVPELIGFNEDDAHIFVISRYPGIEEEGINRTRYDFYFWTYVRYASLLWPDTSRWEDVYQALRFYYADWPYFDNPLSNRDMMGDFETDVSFGYTADEQAKYHMVNDTVYFYVFDYVPELSPLHPWIGAYHTLENTFIFGWPYMDLDGNEMAYNHFQVVKSEDIEMNYTSTDIEYSDFIITLWTNFAKYGNPTPEPILGPNSTEVIWPPFINDGLNYMDLKPEPVVKQDYRQQEYAFWSEYMSYLIYGTEFNGHHKSIMSPVLIDPEGQIIDDTDEDFTLFL